MSYTSHIRVRHAILLPLLLSAAWLTGCKDSSSNTADFRDTAQAPYSAAALGETRAAESSSLQWMAPATRSDGTKLYSGEIRGYRIYYKLRHQDKFHVLTINDASRTRYPLKGFKPGIYDFSVTTLDTEGLESQQSQTISVNVI